MMVTSVSSRNNAAQAVRLTFFCARLKYSSTVSGGRNIANTPARHSDRTNERFVVARIRNQAQVRKNVLDLAPIVERNGSDDLVRHAAPSQRLFKCP